MLDIIEKVRAMCREQPFEEKYLVIPSYRMKGQIRKYLNDHGVQTVNLKIVSAGSVSLEWAEQEILNRGSRVLSRNDVADLVGEVLADLKAKGRLEFLKDSLITPGLNRIVSNGILELKKNGIRQGKVQLSALENPDKRNDLKRIYEAYEDLLRANNYLDHADLLEIAINNIRRTGISSAACVIMPGVGLSYLERQLLSLLMPAEQEPETKTAEPPPLELAGKPWSFVKAYGEYNEVKQVVRHIVTHKIPLDTVLVAVTTEEPYAQLFYQLFQAYLPGPGVANARTEIPVTFGTGLPVTFSNPGKLALALLKWIKYGYRAHDLVSIFSSGSFNLAAFLDGEGAEGEEDTEEMSPQTIIRVIKDSNLKWQRKTYHKTLETHKRYLERKIEEYSTNPEAKKRFEARWEALCRLDRILEQDFFANLPEADEDGCVDADRLYRGVGRIIQKYKRILGDLDTGGYDAVMEEFSGSLKTEPVPISEAVDIAVDRIKQIRTLVSDPRPGKLHLTGYRTAGWIDRENTFLLGMDAGRFPGLAVEDPFLLDGERISVAGELLPTSREKIDENIRSMDRFLRSVWGKLVLSYSCFDNVDQREQYPSGLYLEMRDIIGEETVAGFQVTDQQSAIDENDEWIRLAMTHGAIGEEAILDRLTYSHPEIACIKCCISTKPSPIGHVRVKDPASTDPRRSGIVQSASALADYLNCKYKYLLKYIMLLKEFKERQFDTIGWLDPLESGSLFHEILEKFHNLAMEDPRIRRDEDAALSAIQEIAATTISRYEEDLPTASAFYTAMKKEDILLDCKVYAMEEVEKHHLYEPIETEFRFGFEGDLVLDLGQGESIRVMGAIDRIDRLADGTGLRIVDYKTGGDSTYRILEDTSAPPLNHKSLQPALYYLALKELAKGDVKEAVYHFVNRKGDYKERVIRFSPDSEKEYKEGLRSMFQMMSEGDFQQSELTEKQGNKSKHEIFDQSYLCRYCGYGEICAQSLWMEADLSEVDPEEVSGE